MTIKLNGNKEKVEAAVTNFVDTIKNTEATPEQGAEAMKNMTEAFTASFMDEHKEEMKADLDNQVLATRGQGMTSSEVKFFNEMKNKSGFDNEQLLPETLIEKAFEDLVSARPLLGEINMQNTGLVTRVIKSDAKDMAAWGKVFGEITKQLETAFHEEDIKQAKLTAFVVVPDDLLQYGPKWIQRYVLAQINEAFAAALEKAIVDGDGKDKPVGLMMDLDENGVAKPKEVAGTLTFTDSETTVSEIADIMGKLSVSEKGKTLTVGGKVVLVVNPADEFKVQAQHTSKNAQGQYVTAMPFNIRVVGSEFVPAGKVVAFVNSRYEGYVGGGINIKRFDQTLALEDCILYTAKQFAFGKPADNNSSFVYDLDISGSTPS